MHSFQPPRLSRRRLLQLSSLSSMGLLLNSCGMPLFSSSVAQVADPLNQRLGELLLKPQTPVPEYLTSAIVPQQLLINTFGATPEIDPATFKLTIDGEVNQPLRLSMAELRNMPLTSMVIQHVCVEGWAAIVQWGGVRLRDLVAIAQPKSTVRYAFFYSADGYSSSWDIASALHPQTLMAYQKNGQLLPIDNGAPLRLAAPIKLGYKQSKWVNRVTLLSQLPSQKGYWEDQGYEWFAGL